MNPTVFVTPLQHAERLRIHWERVSASVLFFQQRDRPPKQIHIAPLEVEDLTLSEARISREDNDLLQPYGRG